MTRNGCTPSHPNRKPWSIRMPSGWGRTLRGAMKMKKWSSSPATWSTIRTEGLSARHGEHLMVADTASAFAEAVSRLLACSNTRTELGMAGRLLLEKEFTWESAWKKLDF